MIDINKVVLPGTIAEPRLAYLESGKPELRLSLTVEQDGGFRLYVQCFCYGARAEPLAETLEAGDRVLVDGKLSWRSQTKNGVKESKMVVTCFDVQVVAPSHSPQEARSEGGEGDDMPPEAIDAHEASPVPRARRRSYPKQAMLGGFVVK